MKRNIVRAFFGVLALGVCLSLTDFSASADQNVLSEPKRTIEWNQTLLDGPLQSSHGPELNANDPTEEKRRPGHLLVRFKENASQTEVARLKSNRVVRENMAIKVTHLKVPVEEEMDIFFQLKQSPDVEFVEFDSRVTTTFVPNDTYYSNTYQSSRFGSIVQWGLPAVSAPGAWDIAQGDPSTVIAIVDTGVDSSHPDLAQKIVGQYAFVGSLRDGFGHGTHCAGIAAAETNDNTGVAGMCPNCDLLSVKVLDDNGQGYISDVAAGIVYAADQGSRVISLSLGGGGRSETLHSALDYAVAHNSLPVCAMGNDSTSSALEPAYWSSCLSVVAADSNGGKASFSTHGIRADVAAPGVGILSTMPTYTSYLSSNGYRTNYDGLSGTSMATPLVAGIAGLVRSRNPNLTAEQVKGIIMATAGDGRSWSPELGFGIVNAQRAVEAAMNTDSSAPNVNLTSPTNGSTVSKAVKFEAAPSDNTAVHHIDILRGGTRFIRPLIGVSTTTGSGNNSVTIPAWTVFWPSTLIFNGSSNLTAVASDKFGNTSIPNDVALNVQNQLMTFNTNVQVCFPSTAQCPNVSPWIPVALPVTTEAATHLQGTVTFTGQLPRYPSFYAHLTNGRQVFFCGTTGTTMDCYPTTTLLPTSTGRNGSLQTTNYVGGQINGTPLKRGGSAVANINVTLTFPQ